MYKFSIIGLVFLSACISPKEVALFDETSNQPKPKGIGNFYATEIFSDYITHEIWFTQSASCVSVAVSEDIKRNGEGSLHLKWDKVSQACPWLGIGFGWDSWNGKDVKSIINQAAIEMWVRTAEGSRATLPWAACLEDYTGAQAWLGFSSNTVVGTRISEEWTKVRLPLSEFDWNENGADPSNIKQMLIQFEADGEVYVDDIKVVPFDGSFRKRAFANLTSHESEEIDGVLPINIVPTMVNEHKIFISTDNINLYIAGDIYDKTPLQNNNTGDNIWNGDAFEIAFATEANLSKTRGYLRTTDQHFGISMSENPVIWSWRNHKIIEGATLKVIKNTHGYQFEASIPIASLGAFSFKEETVYGFEMAIDQGDGKGRNEQLRWNNPGGEGFHNNPGLWGEVIFRQNTAN